jgi:hypothetical protein
MIETMKTAGRTAAAAAVGRKWLVALVCLCAWAAAPQRAVAQELEIETDARLEGYTEKMALEPANTAMTWAGFAFCSVVALLGLFKDAKRTHLD